MRDSNEIGIIISKMACISREIDLSKSRIKSEKQEIKDSEDCILKQQQMIIEGETELTYLMEQLTKEFQKD